MAYARATGIRSKTSKPSLCKFYNSSGGCRREEQGEVCPYLHMCKFYILGRCKFHKECKRNHYIYDPQVKEVLSKNGIDVRTRKPKEIIDEIRRRMPEVDKKLDEEVEAGEESQTTVSTNDLTDAEICIFYLRGKCAFGKNCRKLHTNKTYVWQYCKQGQWSSFPPDKNEEIELMYCDAKNVECPAKTSDEMLIKVNLDTMKGEEQIRGRVASQLDIRRLTTPSSETEKFQPLATTWRWFWRDNSGNWCEYGQQVEAGSKATVDSSSMEQSYLENPDGQMKFSTGGHDYVMDFNTMQQQNTVHKTRRQVRRRPVFVDQKTMELRKKQSPSSGAARGKSASSLTGPALAKTAMSYIPETWEFAGPVRTEDQIIDHYRRTEITGVDKYTKEVQDIKDLFYKTMQKSANITCVERIENGELWMNFVSKRDRMKRKRKTDEIDERKLFHGTTSKYVDAICQQGFDFRFSGKTTGTAYGKGSYFAKNALYSDSYTEYGGEKMMFVVKVLVGEYTKGDSSMVRPPPKNAQNPIELYDSCVDKESDPSIFVIFTFDQVYPEYVIKYRKDN